MLNNIQQRILTEIAYNSSNATKLGKRLKLSSTGVKNNIYSLLCLRLVYKRKQGRIQNLFLTDEGKQVAQSLLIIKSILDTVPCGKNSLEPTTLSVQPQGIF